KACAWQLRQKYRVDASPSEAAMRAVATAIAAGGATGCLADPLLLRFLSRTINTDLVLEAFLTEVRRRLCLARNLPPGLNPFLASLALQGFNNGYVFAVGAEEDACVAALRSELEGELSSFAALGPAMEQNLLRHALYAPLTTLAGAKRLLGAS